MRSSPSSLPMSWFLGSLTGTGEPRCSCPSSHHLSAGGTCSRPWCSSCTWSSTSRAGGDAFGDPRSGSPAHQWCTGSSALPRWQLRPVRWVRRTRLLASVLIGEAGGWGGGSGYTNRPARLLAPGLPLKPRLRVNSHAGQLHQHPAKAERTGSLGEESSPGPRQVAANDRSTAWRTARRPRALVGLSEAVGCHRQGRQQLRRGH
jgi:hypothetical protein